MSSRSIPDAEPAILCRPPAMAEFLAKLGQDVAMDYAKGLEAAARRAEDTPRARFWREVRVRLNAQSAASA